MEAVRRTSKKRQAIYDALCATKAHPSAEQIYSQLKPTIPDLSLGTVYRNLAVLLEDGLIQSVGTVNGEVRYDADVSIHPHFVCTKCGKVYDILIDLDVKSCYSNVEVSTRHKVKSHSLTMFGECCDCTIRQ